MRKQFLPFIGIGVVVAALAVALVFYLQRGAHVELQGVIQKVRTLAVEEKAAIAVVDFRFVNSSDYLFIVREVSLLLEDARGQIHDGAVVSEGDAQRIFEYYPALGQKYNPSLVARTRIAARQSMDRMLAARFEVPEKELQARRRLIIRVEEVDGAVSEIAERAR